MLFRRYNLALSTTLTAVLLLVALILAGSAQGAGDYSSEPMDTSAGTRVAAVPNVFTRTSPEPVHQRASLIRSGLAAVMGRPVAVQGRLAFAAAAQADNGTAVVVEEPTLTPGYGPICERFWYRFSNNRGHHAYLTLNTNDPAWSTNSGTWVPNLPEAGEYKVEAYVASHPSIDWPCPEKHIGWDTSDARYEIHHTGGTSIVARDQAPLFDEWLNLGTYNFDAGGGGYVKLTDLNGESNLSHTINFSAMRFTLISVPPSDSTPPTVDTFSVQPDSVTLGNAFTIEYTVSDTGGAGLKQVELWRATDIDGDGEPNWPTDPLNIHHLSGEPSYPGTFYDSSH